MSEHPLTKTLFVCIGNSCRSPMAEAIAASKYPKLFEASSAGISPTNIVQPMTFSCLLEKGFELSEAKRPAEIKASSWESMDLIVNISGFGVLGSIPGYKRDLLVWEVADPIGRPIGAYRQARDTIELLIDRLAKDLRRRRDAEKTP